MLKSLTECAIPNTAASKQPSFYGFAFELEALFIQIVFVTSFF